MLLVALPYHSGDFPLALANLQLIADLGGVTDFPLMLVTDQTTTHAHRSEMQRVGLSAFKSVEVLNLDNVPSIWPQGPNIMFERTAYHVSTAHPTLPFLFLEPDVTVTRPTWLREISAAYGAHGKLFMGAVRDTYGTDARRQRIVTGKHMVGVGVYPPQFYFQSNIIRYLHVSPALYDSVNRVNNARGFDISLGDEITLAGCYNSELFAHSWRTSNYREEGGRIICDRESPNANFDEPNLRIPALIHGAKDTSLIALVRRYQSPYAQNGIDVRNAPFVVDETSAQSENVDPEYAEFLAWKAQKNESAKRANWPLPSVLPNREEQIANMQSIRNQIEGVNRLVGSNDSAPAFVPTVFPVRSPEQQAMDVHAVQQSQQAQAAQSGLSSANGIRFLPEAEAIRQSEQLREVVGIGSTPPRPVIPHEPTTQAELIAARQAQGGFGDELDSGFGVDLPQGALTQPAPPVQVADIPASREAEASVASNSQVVAAETVPAEVRPRNATLDAFLSTRPETEKQAAGRAIVQTAANIADTPFESAVSGEQKTEAIKADIRSGMAHKLLLATHHINPVALKKLKAEVAQESLATA